MSSQLNSTIVDNGSLQLTLVSTAIGCDDGKFEVEYWRSLNQATRYETDGKTLLLFDESGQLLLTYRRDDKYLIPPPIPTTFINIPCDQPNNNC